MTRGNRVIFKRGRTHVGRSQPVPASVAVLSVLLSLPACSRSVNTAETRPLDVHRILGEVGPSPGQISYPRGLDFDGEYLWIVDKSARVQRLDPRTGRCVGGWTMPEYLLGKPTGITVGVDAGGKGVVYVPDTHYHRVVIYEMPPAAPEGTSVRDVFLPAQPPVVAQFGEYGNGDGQFVYPTDVAVLKDPARGNVLRLYVSEYGGNDRISVWEPDADGKYHFRFAFGTFGSGSSGDDIQFNRPQSIDLITVDGTTELLVADACNHRIGRFTLEGKLIAWIGSVETVGDGPGQFKYPYGIFPVGDGTALVAEFGNNRIQHINLITAKGLGSYGGAGRQMGQLINPWAVTVHGDEVFVLDSQNNRIVVTDIPGVHAKKQLAGVSP
jgi:tripartite motif-containing protein 71